MAKLNIVDVQTILSVVERDLDKIEKRIEFYDSKYDLTYLQQEKYDELDEKRDQLEEYKESLETIVNAFDEIISATDMMDF